MTATGGCVKKGGHEILSLPFPDSIGGSGAWVMGFKESSLQKNSLVFCKGKLPTGL